MIFDRKYSDLVSAKKITDEKIRNFLPLTEEEQKIIDRAYFNTKAINRITQKMNEIWNMIVDEGLSKVENEDIRDWDNQEIFTIVNFGNIRSNIIEISQKMVQLGKSDYLARSYAITNNYSYSNLNNIEELLFDIYSFLDLELQEQIGNDLYIYGAFGVDLRTIRMGVLTIE